MNRDSVLIPSFHSSCPRFLFRYQFFSAQSSPSTSVPEKDPVSQVAGSFAINLMISAAITPLRFVGGTERFIQWAVRINFLIARSFSTGVRTITSASRKSLVKWKKDINPRYRGSLAWANRVAQSFKGRFAWANNRASGFMSYILYSIYSLLRIKFNFRYFIFFKFLAYWKWKFLPFIKIIDLLSNFE